MLKQQRRMITILCIFITNTLFFATAVSAANKSGAITPGPARSASNFKMKPGGAFSMNRGIRPRGGTQVRIRPPGSSTSRLRSEAIERARKQRKLPSQTVQQNRIDPTIGNKEPGELKIPEVSANLRDPSRGPRNPGEMRPDWQQPEPAPLPDGVNEGMLDRGPTTAPPQMSDSDLIHTDSEGAQAYNRYQQMNSDNDVSGSFRGDGNGYEGSGNPWGDQIKVDNWGTPSGPHGADGKGNGTGSTGQEPLPGFGDNTENEGYMSPEEKNRRAQAGEDLGVMQFDEAEVVNEDEIPDESTDPPPEELVSRGISMGDGSSRGNRGGGKGQFTPPRNISKEKHNREIHRRTRGVDIDPEDGGPDESIGAGRVVAMDKGRLNLGHTSKPAPDAGEGGGPVDPGPNAVQGQINLPSAGQASSPTPDAGQGGGPIDPGPNAVQGQLNLTSAGQAAYPTPDAGHGGGPIDPGPNAAQ